MLLKKIYSEPENLFKTVTFHNGINFVFGEKSSSTDPKKSLNGIGKSTLLDLIDFCLLSSFSGYHNPRIYSAKHILAGHSIALEFEVDNKTYVIKRSTDNHNKVYFGRVGNNEKIQEYSKADLSKHLSTLIFKRKDYEGIFSNKWWRRLVPFFVKIQSQKKESFIDPIKYIKELTPTELNQYLFFLLGLNNELVVKNHDIQSNLKRRIKALKEVRELVEQTYGLKDISEATDEIDKANNEIKKLENAISKFKLSEQYKDVEAEANKLTAEIKELWFQNFSDRKRIDSYQSSLKLDTNIDIPKIKRVYEEFNVLLGEAVSATLNEAIEFRKNLIESRKEFIASEVSAALKRIENREQKIREAEKERIDLFTFLSTKKAVNDLSEAYLLLSKKKDKHGELEGKIRLYSDLQKERADLKIEATKMEKAMFDFVNSHASKISSYRTIFHEVYNAVYPESKNESMFILDVKPGTNAIINVNINLPAMHSKGKNQGRTLVFDLAVLFHSIKHNLPGPKFLVHDGIFDGIDKAHFVYLYKYLETKKSADRFQYIVTLNEEGTLSEKFGEVDELTPEKISSQAVAVFTPKNKLFNKDF